MVIGEVFLVKIDKNFDELYLDALLITAPTTSSAKESQPSISVEVQKKVLKDQTIPSPLAPPCLPSHS